ncbi:MAG: AAA family ATPase, partial [Nitrospinaceae bacterium]|nr:AAA family ATPase [Nitrospinaceae bacterium]NIR55712.1 AAA family ATPase [Nitrospinaceae bacterium]NIS83730.1 AAA family ATPase [Nitrospinaceae bacterium]NIT80527.1 AAA family ATPase [Nitrospinaceae bacterium]NIU42854.1 AAA family ATPase [Nitrospinaceae bacterium]
AEENRALLFFDEADSFLRPREAAVRSWEVTEVNELLTQMETFRGVFLCATNFLNGLDSAALRRFTFKVEFR